MKNLMKLLVVVFVMLTCAKAYGDDKGVAKEHYAAGVKLLRADNLEGAAVEFKKSVDLYPTKNGLYKLATCLFKLRRYTEAQEAINALVDRFGRKIRRTWWKEIDRMKKEISGPKKETSGQLSKLEISVSPAGALIRVDDKEIGRSPLAKPLVLDPAEHILRAELEGYQPFEQRVTLVPGGTIKIDANLEKLRTMVIIKATEDAALVSVDGKRVGITPLASGLEMAPGRHKIDISRDGFVTEEREVDLKAGQSLELPVALRAKGKAAAPSPTDTGKREEVAAAKGGGALRAIGWTTAALGSALIVGGAVTGAWALSLNKKLYGDCPERACTEDRWDDVDKLDTLKLTTDVLLGSGGALLVAAIIVLNVSDSDADDETTSQVTFAPLIGRDGASLSIGWRQ